MSNAPAHDAYLENLVRIADHGVSVDVTLMVGGQLISGEIVSGREYFEAMKGVFAPQVQGELGGVFARMFDTRIKAHSGDDLAADYIHLKHAQAYVAGKFVPASKGLYWRGRLAQVDGFNLGLLG